MIGMIFVRRRLEMGWNRVKLISILFLWMVYMVAGSEVGQDKIDIAYRWLGDLRKYKCLEEFRKERIEERIKEPIEEPIEEIKKVEVIEESIPLIPLTTASSISVLVDKVICIDPGHQAKGNSQKEKIAPQSQESKNKVSSGTRGVVTKKYEYELNLEVALKLKKALEDKGAKIHMTREIHDVNISNAERAQLGNQIGADLSIRLHADGSSSSSVRGYSLLVPGNKYVDEQIVETSKAIAKELDQIMQTKGKIASRGIVTRNDLTGFNWSEVPVVLVEMGFMSNPEEDQLMSQEDFQNTLVQSIVEGLENYFK